MAQIVHLADRSPQVTPDQLLAGFHPSYRFGTVSFDTYIPDPAHPSQAQAVERLRRFAADLGRGGSGGGLPAARTTVSAARVTPEARPTT